MANQYVYPPRNLPGLAEDWGRAVEAQDKILENNQTQLGQTVDNALRATGGQLAVQGSQIDTLTMQQAELSSTVTEISSRVSHTTSPANLSVTGNATVPPFPTSTQVFTLPAPNVQRSAILGFSAGLTNTGGSTTPVRAYVELLFGATVVGRWDGSVPLATSAPTGWLETVNLFSFITVPGGVDPTFSVRIHRVGFTATSTTLTINNMTAFIQYGDPV